MEKIKFVVLSVVLLIGITVSLHFISGREINRTISKKEFLRQYAYTTPNRFCSADQFLKLSACIEFTPETCNSLIEDSIRACFREGDVKLPAEIPQNIKEMKDLVYSNMIDFCVGKKALSTLTVDSPQEELDCLWGVMQKLKSGDTAIPSSSK